MSKNNKTREVSENSDKPLAPLMPSYKANIVKGVSKHFAILDEIKQWKFK